MTDQPRSYETSLCGPRRSAPAALRNREPIAAVLGEWLPERGVVLEIASGTGEHVVYFAEGFPGLEWQPSDLHLEALDSIRAWRNAAGQPNLREPIVIDAAAADWPVSPADAVLNTKVPSESREEQEAAENSGFSAVLCINMVHISPWKAALGLLAGAAKVLRIGGALILYGPWLKQGIVTAPSNLAFDQQLRSRDPAWGLRRVEDFEAQAAQHGFALEQVRSMPANNLMLLFRLKQPTVQLLS